MDIFWNLKIMRSQITGVNSDVGIYIMHRLTHAWWACKVFQIPLRDYSQCLNF